MPQIGAVSHLLKRMTDVPEVYGYDAWPGRLVVPRVQQVAEAVARQVEREG